jgi:hypothetical protein
VALLASPEHLNLPNLHSVPQQLRLVLHHLGPGVSTARILNPCGVHATVQQSPTRTVAFSITDERLGSVYHGTLHMVMRHMRLYMNPHPQLWRKQTLINIAEKAVAQTGSWKRLSHANSSSPGCMRTLALACLRASQPAGIAARFKPQGLGSIHWIYQR